jgi:uncharacterized protein YkwD
METEVLIDTRTEPPVSDTQQARELVALVAVTGDQELISTLRSIAERITLEAESAASALRERGRRVRSEAAQALADVSEMVSKAQEDARLTALAADEATDEALQQHLRQMADTDEARLHEGLEWIERARLRMEEAEGEARALEAEAIAARQQALSRPEVIAWRELITPFLDRIKRAGSRRAVDITVEDAERQGFADSQLREAAALRERQLGELAWRTRETVKLWARYAAGADRTFSRITLLRTSMLAACGPGTIFEVSSDRHKVAVHVSQDGLSWVRREASGPFRARGALVRRINGFANSVEADNPPSPCSG